MFFIKKNLKRIKIYIQIIKHSSLKFIQISFHILLYIQNMQNLKGKQEYAKLEGKQIYSLFFSIFK
jgi:hypothetical protein